MKQILICALVAMGLFSVNSAEALSCVESPGPEVEFQEAQAVFTGEATHVFNNDGSDYTTRNYAKFRVDKVYKGELPRNLTIETDGTWGMRFEAGKKYLVYLDKLGPYVVDMCRFGTMSLEDPQAWERVTQIEASGHKATDPHIENDAKEGQNLWNLSDKQIMLLEWVGAALLMAAGYVLIKKYY